jgi:long-chain acyl-CoA synthetase
MQTLRDVIDHQAASQPDAPFLLAPEPESVITYAQLRNSAGALASELAAEGIRPGEVVSTMLPNGISSASLFFGAMYGGFIVSPVNLLAQDSQLEYTLAHSQTRVIFAAPEYVEHLRTLLARIGHHALIRPTSPDALEFAVTTSGGTTTASPPEPSSAAMLMYTSGTTGVPKGALLSHANMVHAGRAVAEHLALTNRDRVLSSLPLYHINGQVIATVGPVVSGGSIVMPHRFSVSSWWPLVERYRPTWLNVVPTIIAYLCHGHDLSVSQADACRGVRFARSASAPLPPEQHRLFEQRFDISVIEAMGLTECASIAFSNPLDPAKRRYGSVGLPLGIEARVVAPDGRVLPATQSGEIQLRGPSVMLGYYKDPDTTARTIDADGWLATGDLGFRDVDGFYFITGRLKELIIKGGENIAPREIDEALLKHPAVLEAAAVGVPDRAYGQEILACVVLKPGVECSEDELRQHCLHELGRYKTPKRFRFLGALPKGPSGKVQRLKLAETVQ